MATNTTHYNLAKPAYTEPADIGVINGDMDLIDSALHDHDTTLGKVEGSIAIVATGNTHAAITSGQYVYVKEHTALADGLYTASTNISKNATLSSSNLTAVSGGGMNALKAYVDSLNSNIGSTTFTATAVTSRGTILSGGAYTAGKLLIIQFTFKSASSATNSPGIVNINKSLPCDAALTAIDITSGISSAITSSIPCGISESGHIFIKEVVTDHIYAVSGVVRYN